MTDTNETPGAQPMPDDKQAGLVALAERVEALSGPDRRVDAEIAAAVRYFPKGVGFVWQSSLTPNSPEVGRVECCTGLGTGGPHYAAPAYSTSLDAAMGLVPEALSAAYLSVMLQRTWEGRGKVRLLDSLGGQAWDADGATPALALTAAALRALAQQEGGR